VVSTSLSGGAFSLGDGNDTVTFTAGATATFTSVETINGSTSDDVVTLKANYDHATIDLDSGSDTVVFAGAGTATLSHVEIVTGSSRENEITLSGSTGVTADMGGGNDIVHMGLGADTITGGSGADEFIFTSAAQSDGTTVKDIITDFSSGDDMLTFSGLSGGTSTLNYLGDDATLTSTSHSQAYFDTTNNELVIDVNGDGTADMKIKLTGLTTFDSSDINWS
jgi:hypothetical protein